MSERAAVVVVCVGNLDRGDDGVGLALLRPLRARLPSGVEVVATQADPASLLEAWRDRRAAVVVDAIRSGAPPGSVHRLVCVEVTAPGTPPAAAAGQRVAPPATSSSHGLGVETAVALGRELGCLPRRVVVVGIEAADVALGSGLSAAVNAGLEAAVAAVATEVRSALEMSTPGR